MIFNVDNVDSVVELLEKAKSATDAWFKERNAEESFEEVFERKFISIIKEFLEDEAKL